MNQEQPNITHDPATWPTGDKIWEVCRAIAFAEGAHIEGSNPDRLNNPGDISDWWHVYGGERHSGSDITRFLDKYAGWYYLHEKIYNIMSRTSNVYSPYMTWKQIADKWAANSESWLIQVTRSLSVEPTSTLEEYVNG